MVRVKTPSQPAALAASNRKLPVVSAPVPPLPTIAIEILGEAPMAKTLGLEPAPAGRRLQYVFKYYNAFFCFSLTLIKDRQRLPNEE